MIDKIFVFGASITHGPWWTWKDFLEIESKITATDLSLKGVGNTYMMHSILDQPLDENSLVVGMLTNVDKFDWYVEGKKYRSLSSQKHAPIPVGSDSGFWCTGSWFPLDKRKYLELFYSLDFSAAQNIQQLCALKYFCAVKKCKLEIFFDSPIWAFTEQDLNKMITTGQAGSTRCMLDLPLTKKWSKLLTNNEIYNESDSLIGYCWHHNLPWGNSFYNGHPPSSSHWQFYQEIVRPRISQHLDLDPIGNMSTKIAAMDLLWKSC